MPANTLPSPEPSVDGAYQSSSNMSNNSVQAMQDLRQQFGLMRKAAESIPTGELALQAIERMQEEHQEEIRHIHSVHKTDLKKQLQLYTESKEDLAKEKSELEEAVSVLKTQLGNEQESNKKQKEQESSLMLESKQMKKELDLANAEVAKSNQRIEDLEKENEKAQDQLESANRDLEQVRSVWDGFHRNKPVSFEGRVQKLCSSVIKTVGIAFQSDIDQKTFKLGSWEWKLFIQLLEGYEILPLSPLNMKEAKMMRVAASLAYFAGLLFEEILVPTYIVDRKSQLHAALTREVEDSDLLEQDGREPEARELLCRAALLQLQAPIEPGKRVERVNSVVEKMTQLVGTLQLKPEVVTTFQDSIRTLVEELADTWSKLMRCQDRVQADTYLSPEDKWDWTDWKRYKTSASKKDSDEQPSDNVQPADAAIVIFPRIYAVYPDGYDPVFSGVVVRKHQTEQAKNEIGANGMASPLATDSQLGQRKPVTSRRVSTSTAGRNRNGSFFGESSRKDGANGG